MKVADIFEVLLGGDAEVGVTAYDGSSAGASDAENILEVNSPDALNYLATAPSALGVARAFVTGTIDVRGDLATVVRAMAHNNLIDLPLSEKWDLVRAVAAGHLRRPPLPPEEARVRGLRHSKRRDAKAISHHYDVSNTFYRMLLGPSMAYTCAVFPTPEAGLDEAQEFKFDLVCRKLDLRPGMRLLDVGCGWGGMVLHAARHYDVEVVGVTLSRPQAEYGAKQLAEAGLNDRAEIRHGDYRDIAESGFDRVSSIGLTEHIGLRNYPDYFAFLRSKLVPDGLLLNHTITRNDGTQRARARGFINRYIFPDGELAGPAAVMAAMNDAGFELQHEENFRRHYALTLAHWVDNLRGSWDEAVAEVGLGKARTWWLYLAASQVGFETNRIQLHQFLGSRATADGATSYRWRNEF